MSSTDLKQLNDKQVPTDLTGAATATPTEMVQLKAALGGMSYDEQVAAVQPPMPILLNATSEGQTPAVGDAVQMAKGGKGKTFRGGSKKRRDNWYGYNDKQFQRWWHREGKAAAGGDDIDNAQEAKAAYDEWVSLGKPNVK